MVPRTAATQDDLRRHNRARLLRRLHEGGAATRSDLVAFTGLNRSIEHTFSHGLGQRTQQLGHMPHGRTLISCRRLHEQLGTGLAVNPPSQFGCFDLADGDVRGFAEKPLTEAAWINGGFFFFRRDFLHYLSDEDSCVLEREPLQRLARDGELKLFHHQGFWSCIDTVSDRDRLSALYETGATPWLGAPAAVSDRAVGRHRSGAAAGMGSPTSRRRDNAAD